MLCQLEIFHKISTAHGALVRLGQLCIVTVHVQIEGGLTDVRAIATRTMKRIRIAVMLNVIQHERTIEELLAATLEIAGQLMLAPIVRDGLAQHRELRFAQVAMHLEVVSDANVLLGNLVGCVSF